MLTSARPRLTYANIVATVALLLSLGGVSWAASLPRNSVGTAQLKNGSVTAAKLHTGAVTSPKLAAGSVLTTHLHAGSVTASAIATGAVGADELLNGGVTVADVAPAVRVPDSLDGIPCGEGSVTHRKSIQSTSPATGQSWNVLQCVYTTPGLNGDGILQVGETCDDGNVVAGDGCDATSRLESVSNLTVD